MMIWVDWIQLGLATIIVVAATTFLLMYRPWGRHLRSPAGRHLQAVAFAVVLLFGSEILLVLLPVPVLAGVVINLTTLALFAAVMIERTCLRWKYLRGEKAHGNDTDR